MTGGRRPRGLLAVGVVVLVLAAGCGGLSGGGTPTPTTTTPTDDGMAFPTGFGEEGVTDGAAALNGHTNVLLAQGNFTFAFVSEAESEGGTTNTTLVNRVDTERRTALRTITRPEAVATQYVAGGTAYTRIDPRDNRAVQYRSANERVDPDGATARALVGALLGGVSWENPEQVTVDGERAVAYEAGGLTNASAVLDVDAGAVDSFEATLVVANSGVVREVTYAATYTSDGREVTDRVTVRFEAVGTTDVEEPAWVDRQF